MGSELLWGRGIRNQNIQYKSLIFITMYLDATQSVSFNFNCKIFNSSRLPQNKDHDLLQTECMITEIHQGCDKILPCKCVPVQG